MDIEGTEFTDNVLERFGNGQNFSGEDLEKLLYVVEKKLTLVSSKYVIFSLLYIILQVSLSYH